MEFVVIYNLDVKQKVPEKYSKIFFGMGCFWGAERKFWQLDGVYTTFVGYAGGHTKNPTYEEVCTGNTGHAEVVKVIYDKQVINIDSLLKIFWEAHDPTQLNRQGNDLGTQYRSLILTSENKELNLLETSKLKYQQRLDANAKGLIKTEIKLLDTFFFAEDYHQKYLYKNPNGYCGLQGLNIRYL